MRVDRALASVALAAGLFACKRESVVPSPDAEPPTKTRAVIVEAEPVAPVCNARSSRGALALVPEAPAWLFHMSPREVMKSTLWSLLEPTFAGVPEWTGLLTAFDRCDLDWRGVEHLIIAVSPDPDEFLVIGASPGIGQPRTAQCLMLELQSWAGSERAAELVPWPGDPSVSMIDLPDGRAYLFADDLLAITTAAWEAPVGELSRCVGRPAIEGETGSLLARVDINAPIWLVAHLGPDVAPELQAMFELGGGSMNDATLSMRLEQGATLAIDVSTSGPSTATTLADNLRALMVMAPPALQRTVIETDGARLLVRGSASAEELRSTFAGI